MVVQYIGVHSRHKGNHLFHLLLKLPNKGIGRVITRSCLPELNKTNFTQFPEKSYYIVRRIDPIKDEKNLFGRIWADYYFRGRLIPDSVREPVTLCHDKDWILVDKKHEKEYLEYVPPPITELIYPSEIPLPTFWTEIRKRDQRLNGLPVDPAPPMIKVTYPPSLHDRYRGARPGEQPTESFTDVLYPQFKPAATGHNPN